MKRRNFASPRHARLGVLYLAVGVLPTLFCPGCGGEGVGEENEAPVAAVPVPPSDVLGDENVGRSLTGAGIPDPNPIDGDGKEPADLPEGPVSSRTLAGEAGGEQTFRLPSDEAFWENAGPGDASETPAEELSRLRRAPEGLLRGGGERGLGGFEQQLVANYRAAIRSAQRRAYVAKLRGEATGFDSLTDSEWQAELEKFPELQEYGITEGARRSLDDSVGGFAPPEMILLTADSVLVASDGHIVRYARGAEE